MMGMLGNSCHQTVSQAVPDCQAEHAPLGVPHLLGTVLAGCSSRFEVVQGVQTLSVLHDALTYRTSRRCSILTGLLLQPPIVMLLLYSDPCIGTEPALTLYATM